MKNIKFLLICLSLYSSCLFAFQTQDLNKFLKKLVTYLERDEYPHEFAQPLLRAIFKISDFKTLTNSSGNIYVSIQTQHMENKLVSHMVAGYPNPCEFFKEMMAEFYSDHNLVNNRYGDITLTFSGFSPAIIQFLQTQNKNTPTHQFSYDKDSIIIVFNQKFFEENHKLLENSYKYCSADPGQYLLYKTLGWAPAQSMHIQTTASRHAALVVQDNRTSGKDISSEQDVDKLKEEKKPTIPSSINTSDKKRGPVEVKTNR